MKVTKKVMKKYFDMILDGKKNWEFRIADFKIGEGDILELIEVDDKSREPTGRKIEKKVKNVVRFNPMEFYKLEDIAEKGVQVISF